MADTRTKQERSFRLSLGSGLLFLSVGVLVLGSLVWYYDAWGLSEVQKNPDYVGGPPLGTWDFLGSVFLAVMLAPVLGLAFDPVLRHFIIRKGIPLSPLVSGAMAIPFWYVAFLPTYFSCLRLLDSSTSQFMLFAPFLCAFLTGLLHGMMVHFAARSRKP